MSDHPGLAPPCMYCGGQGTHSPNCPAMKAEASEAAQVKHPIPDLKGTGPISAGAAPQHLIDRERPPGLMPAGPINAVAEPPSADIEMTLNEYQSLATQSAIYPGRGNYIGMMYVGLKLNGEAGEFAEHVGKAARDDGYGTSRGQLMQSRREALIKELGDVLWYVSAGGNELGVTLEDIARVNIQKLRDRQVRGMLGGSGDDR